MSQLAGDMWANEFVNTDPDDANFDVFGSHEVTARQLVKRAINDWNAVITDQNVDRNNDPDTNNDFELTLYAADLVTNGLRGDALITEFTTGLASQGQSGWTVGAPRKATVRVDNNAGGPDWFFDQTPTDDAEFSAIANSDSTSTGAAVAASFVDVNGQSIRDDFYRTGVHEIGHALGLTSDPSAAIFGMLKNLVHQNGRRKRVRTIC